MIQDILKTSIPVIAVVGSIYLGFSRPDVYGQVVIAVLSGAVSGFYGSVVPFPEKEKEDHEQ